MNILIADDDPTCRRNLQSVLEKGGHQVELASDGLEALRALERAQAPKLAILDWIMPELDGVEVCRKLRGAPTCADTYVILLTCKQGRDNLVCGLQAGANDYITKPFDYAELQARVQVGIRVVELQDRLARRVAELEEALSNIKQLRGLLPICSYCKRIRDDGNYWRQVEAYVVMHSDAQFTHGICPNCYETLVKPSLQTLEP